MTHSLHRKGAIESLKHDFVWQPYPSHNINDDNLPEKFKSILKIVEDIGSVNWGDIKTGPKVCKDPSDIKNKLSYRSRIRGVFTEKAQVVEFLKRMKKLDTGLSVVISGLTDDVIEACYEAGLKPHSINMSLGVWGKKELLPPNEILEVTTMCGHHMISSNIVRLMINKIRKREINAEQGGKELAKLCPCGIFNSERAAMLLAKIVDK